MNCKTCGNDLDESEFGSDGRGGLRKTCRTCRRVSPLRLAEIATTLEELKRRITALERRGVADLEAIEAVRVPLEEIEEVGTWEEEDEDEEA